MTWTQFLRSQAAIACDFATIDTAPLHRYYLLFFIDVTTREVFFAGITANPSRSLDHPSGAEPVPVPPRPTRRCRCARSPGR